MRPKLPAPYPEKRLIVFAGTIPGTRAKALQACAAEAVMASYLYVKDLGADASRELLETLDAWPQYRYLDSGIFTFLRAAGATKISQGAPNTQAAFQKDFKNVHDAIRTKRVATKVGLAKDLGLSPARIGVMLGKLVLQKRVRRVDPQTYEWESLSDDCDLHIDVLSKYIEDYVAYITGPGTGWDFIFDIDIDALTVGNSCGKVIKGGEVADYCRRLLKKAVGDRFIPVWHHEADERGYPKFKKMLEEHRYIAIGSDISTKARELRYLCDLAHRAGVLVHGLGTSRADVLSIMPFDTTDSTTWLSIIRFGKTGSEKLTNKPVKTPREVADLRGALSRAKQDGYASSVLLGLPSTSRQALLEVAVRHLQKRQNEAQKVKFLSLSRVPILPTPELTSEEAT